MPSFPPALAVVALVFLLSPPLAGAAEPPDVGFTHKDWELACDNTRTCRAAGYQSESDERAVSVLLTRKAGPRQGVTAELQIGSYDEAEGGPSRAGPTAMKVNGRALGNVAVDKGTLIGRLSAAQTDALIEALTQTGTVTWSNKGGSWTLSGAGATAVLLKMDDFQGRVGTPGALVRKGAKSEDSVLPPVPAPVVNAAPVPASTGKSVLPRAALLALLPELRKDFEDDTCTGLAKTAKVEDELEVARLSAGKLLVSAQCWAGAYNMGWAYWVINAKPPYSPQLVTDQASDYDDGVIASAQKGRGLGDCWSREEWVWDGTRFVQNLSETTGMCRMVTPGGPWKLPTFVSTVRKAKRAGG